VIQAAFREFINRQILHRLDLPKPEQPQPVETTQPIPPAAVDPIVTTEREMLVFKWTLQRLAFLVRDDSLFAEIAAIDYRDYQGKFVVFYKKERKGRLFEFIESKTAPGYRFIFPEESELPQADITVSALTDIDGALLAMFKARVGAMSKGPANAATDD
jgi:hypothetical protein